MNKPKRLGESLVDAGLITQTQLDHALERQKQWGGRLGSNLVLAGILKERELLRFLAKQTGIKEIKLTYSMFSREAVKKVPQKLAEQYNLIPIRMRDKNTLVVALVDPTDLNAIDQVQFATGHKVEPVLASHSAILNAINHFYSGVPLADLGPKRGNEPMDRGDHLALEHQGGGHQALEDPDLIIFGEQSVNGMQPLKPRTQPEQPPAAPPQSSEDSKEFTLDFSGSGPQPAPDQLPAGGSVPPSDITLAHRVAALYRALIRKGLITEDDVNRELALLRERKGR